MFWLIIVPLLAILIIYTISKFIGNNPSKNKSKTDQGGNIYKQTIYRDDD
jgi:hypothetical protein